MVAKYILSIIFLVFIGGLLVSKAQLFTTTIKDSTTLISINSIAVQGNKKTKEYIITRELTLKVGDTLVFNKLGEAIDRSKKNVFNTALFNEVLINVIQSTTITNAFDLVIEVKERWYIIPEPVFELYDRNYKVWRRVYDSDIERIRYGVKFKYNNFTGRRDQLRINLINGFTKELSFSYVQPFADKKLQHGFGVAAGYSKKIGVSYNHSFNAGLPRKLCDSCGTPNFRLFTTDEYFFNTSYQYRKGLYDRHFVGISYARINAADTIVKSNPNFFANGVKKVNVIEFNYSYSYSKVDYFAYPLEGKAFVVGFRQRVATNLGQLLLFGVYNQYYKIQKNVFLSTTLAASHRIANNDKSFFNLRSADMSYGNIRGLEQFLILSKSDITWRNSIRYKLLDKSFRLPIKIRNHEKLPIRLYARTYYDFAYAKLPQANTNILQNQLLRSGGIAIDLITMYDYIWRFELSYNKFTQLSFFIR